MKKILNNTILFLLFMLVGCRTLESNFTIGNFEPKNHNNTLIVFNKNSFYLTVKRQQADSPPFYCCDTITYGKWSFSKKDRLLILDNEEYLNKRVNTKVIEKYIPDKDSFTICFINPLEDYLINNKGLDREILYLFETYASDITHGLFISKMYDSSIIKIYKPSLSKIERFNIFIYPKPNFQGRNVGERYFITPEYTIKDPKSNYFQIEIPELTYEYMTYIRLNKEYIKVIDINHFEWHGEIYSRQK